MTITTLDKDLSSFGNSKYLSILTAQHPNPAKALEKLEEVVNDFIATIEGVNRWQDASGNPCLTVSISLSHGDGIWVAYANVNYPIVK